MGGRRRVIVIGIDGGSWNVIKPLIDSGFLPTFRELLSEGSWGWLKSTIPPQTVPAWYSFSTGKNPGKLGVYFFLNLKRFGDKFRFDMVNSNYISGEIWDILSRHKLTSYVINNPALYPPKRIRGIVVSGFLAPSKYSRYTFPSWLKRKLDDICGGYEIDVLAFSSKSPSQVVTDYFRITSKRIKVFKNFLKDARWDFFMGVFTGSDRVCHVLLNNVENYESKEFTIIGRYFRMIDDFLSFVKGMLGKEDLLIIMSDHGIIPQRRGFYFNKWLVDNGYLKIEELGGRMFLRRVGITQRNIGLLLSKIKLDRWVWAHTPDFLKRVIPEGNVFGEEGGFSIVDLVRSGKINWKETKAIMPVMYLLYIIKYEAQREYYTQFIEELKCGLDGLRDPVTGEIIGFEFIDVRKVYPEASEDAPDYYIRVNDDKWRFLTNIVSKPPYFGDSKLAGHTENGIFIAYGEGVRKIHNLQLRIVDLAPTILHYYNINPPPEMNGRVIREIFY